MSILTEKLVEFRDSQARKEGIEVYKVLQYPTIKEINKAWPKSLEELSKIKGIGPAKLKKYGQTILQIVAGLGDNENNNDTLPSLRGGSSTDRRSNPIVKTEIASSRPNDTDSAPHNDVEDTKQTISVSEYLDYLNVVFQKTADVKIQGEVTTWKEYPNGIYFTLKDKKDDGVLSCFIPVYTYRGLGIPLEEGMEVKVEGMPRMVKRNGRFQFTVETLELAGEGALKKAYELLKKKLEAEGIFARKRPLPEFVRSIGIITSKSGAVIHDFRNNIERLGFTVYLKDVRVEGNQAVPQIVNAIAALNRYQKVLQIDVLVIMRGGGSLEDLQSFNDERVVRAVFASHIPTVVAIGHDKDVPLAQLAADVQVSTPTAAAHAICNSYTRLVQRMPLLTNTLFDNYQDMLNTVDRTRTSLENRLFLKWNGLLQRFKMQTHTIHNAVVRYMAWADHQNGLLNKILNQLTSRVEHQIRSAASKVESAEKFLQQASPERNLQLGYSIVRTAEGKVVKSVKNVKANDVITTQVEDGMINSSIIGTN